MRTVHETEALRPSDPVPRNYSSAHFKPQRLKLIMNVKPPTSDTSDDKILASSSGVAGATGSAEGAADDDATVSSAHETDGENENPHHLRSSNKGSALTNNPSSATAESKSPANNKRKSISDLALERQGIDQNAIPPSELFKYLRRHLHYITQSNEELKAEIAVLEKKHRREWTETQLVLHNLMEAEISAPRLVDDTANAKLIEDIWKDLGGKGLPKNGRVIRSKTGKDVSRDARAATAKQRLGNGGEGGDGMVGVNKRTDTDLSAASRPPPLGG